MSGLRKVEMSSFLFYGREEDGATYESEGTGPDTGFGSNDQGWFEAM
jgi:hypothetical protein